MASSLSVYLREIGRYQLLSPEQELILGRKVQAMLDLQHQTQAYLPKTINKRFSKNFSEKQRRTLHQGERAKQRMITANLRLVVNLAKRYQVRGLDLLDLIQEGSIGLTRAVEKFDPTRGHRFSTYAYWWIRHGLNRALSNQSRTIRIPVNVNEKLARLRATTASYLQIHGRSPSAADLARALNLPVGDVEDLLACELRNVTVSLQGAVRSKSATSDLADLLPSQDPVPMERAEQAERQACAWRLLETANLTPREHKVILMRFGLDSSQRWKTLAEVAQQLDCSSEYCRQVVLRALRKLRKAGIDGGLVEI